MKLNQLAFRNIFRRKRRTLITASSVAFGVLLSVTFTGTGDYTYTHMIDAGAKMGMGHVTIEPVGYQNKPTLNKKLQHIDTILHQVRQLNHVTDAVPRIMGQAMFASANKSIGGVFIAINPDIEHANNNLFIQSMTKGKVFDAHNKRGIVVGHKLAHKLRLKLGKKLVYTTTDASGEIISRIARVTGIFNTGVDTLDTNMVLLPLAATQRALGYSKHEASLIAVLIHDQRKADEVRDNIASLISTQGYDVLSWHEAQPDLAGMIAMDKSMNYISQFLIGLIIAAGILNTMLMSVLERKHEFGMMMAVGLSPQTLFKLVMVESFWLALMGLILGILITAPWFYFLYYHGIDLSSGFGDDFTYGGVLIDPVFKARLFPESIAFILGSVFTLAMLAGAYPAWKAGRTPPIESLKTI